LLTLNAKQAVYKLRVSSRELVAYLHKLNFGILIEGKKVGRNRPQYRVSRMRERKERKEKKMKACNQCTAMK
jgi:hypothetical protein